LFANGGAEHGEVVYLAHAGVKFDAVVPLEVTAVELRLLRQRSRL